MVTDMYSREAVRLRLKIYLLIFTHAVLLLIGILIGHFIK